MSEDISVVRKNQVEKEAWEEVQFKIGCNFKEVEKGSLEKMTFESKLKGENKHRKQWF